MSEEGKGILISFSVPEIHKIIISGEFPTWLKEKDQEHIVVN